MADNPAELYAEVAGTAGGTPLTDPGAGQADPYNRDFADRVASWFKEAWTHPLWVNFRKEAAEDMGFYVGGDAQWKRDGSDADLRALRSQKKAIITENHIQSVVDVLTGFERQNRYDLKASPEGAEDAEDANLLTLIMKHEQEQLEAHALLSEIFEDGTITGASGAYVGIDWTEDPLHGKITLERLFPGEDFLWDPFELNQDQRGARYTMRFRHAFVKDIVAEYPDHKAAIEKAAELLPSTTAGTGVSSDFNQRDGYGSATDHPLEADLGLFWNAAEKKLLIVECWYRDYESFYVVANKKTGSVWEADTWAVAQATAEADPEHLTAVRRQKRTIKMGVVLPATRQTLEEDDQPFENDTSDYPFITYIAKRKGDTMLGIVRNLKDPQRVHNKKESAALDIIDRLANVRAIAEEGTLVNPDDLKRQWSTEPIYYRRGTTTPPSWFTPPLAEVLRALTAMADRGKLAIRESSGINTDLLGLKGDDSSGIAIARRQAQGQIISTVFFDNFRRCKRQFGRRLAKRIQQVYSDERTMRLTSPDGNQIMVTVNPESAKGKTRDEFGRIQAAQGAPPEGQPDTRPRILRDLSALEYDIIVSETPATPSMRAMSLLALLEIIGKMPIIAPALMDVVIELSDIPDRQKVLERVKAIMQAGPPSGPMPSPGGPSPKPSGARGPRPGELPAGPVAGPGGMVPGAP